jgi:hypothetical protein
MVISVNKNLAATTVPPRLSIILLAEFSIPPVLHCAKWKGKYYFCSVLGGAAGPVIVGYVLRVQVDCLPGLYSCTGTAIVGHPRVTRKPTDLHSMVLCYLR